MLAQKVDFKISDTSVAWNCNISKEVGVLLGRKMQMKEKNKHKNKKKSGMKCACLWENQQKMGKLRFWTTSTLKYVILTAWNDVQKLYGQDSFIFYTLYQNMNKN